MQKNSNIKLEFVTCPRCNGEDFNSVATGKDFLHGISGTFFAVECQGCGFWFQNPRPTPDFLSSIYPDDYLPYYKPQTRSLRFIETAYLKNFLKYDDLVADYKGNWIETNFVNFFPWVLIPVWRWKEGINLVPKFVPNGNLLEIGCASGERLSFLRRLGWKNSYGIDFSTDAIEIAKSNDHNVQCGLVEDILPHFPDGSFDVVVSSMVIEHLYNPFIVFDSIARKLRPGGQFLFSTIVADSLDSRLYKDYWGGFDFPRHMSYFHKTDILKTLRENFELIQVFYHSAYIDFVRPATWKIQNGRGSIFDEFIVKMNHTPFANIFGKILALSGQTCRVSFRCRKK